MNYPSLRSLHAHITQPMNGKSSPVVYKYANSVKLDQLFHGNRAGPCGRRLGEWLVKCWTPPLARRGHAAAEIPALSLVIQHPYMCSAWQGRVLSMQHYAERGVRAWGGSRARQTRCSGAGPRGTSSRGRSWTAFAILLGLGG